ncbi:hypothetical protein BDW68DRAFT_188140 [Aspergillus falconensis]
MTINSTSSHLRSSHFPSLSSHVSRTLTQQPGDPRLTISISRNGKVRDRYPVVGKLGYEITSTATFILTLKFHVDAASMGQHIDHKLKMYKRIGRASRHPGRRAIISLVDSFNIDGPEYKRQCLVHPRLFESARDFSVENTIERLPAPGLVFTLYQFFFALDHLHTETLCLLRELKKRPGKVGSPALCDFGSAALAPEVTLEGGRSYRAGTWNVGCMIWNIFERGSLFSGHDLKSRRETNTAIFSEAGESHQASLLKEPTPLEQGERETSLQGEDKECLLRLMRKILQWEAEQRSSAGALVGDEWIKKQTGL